MAKIKASFYHTSLQKILLDYGLILLMSLFLILVFPVVSLCILFNSGFPIFFTQERTGKNGKVFQLIKFRTMVNNASKLQAKYKKLNEADGPVFKIRDDPRYTQIGKFLSRTGLDELPQIINVLKGEMSLVGPRPLPVYEAKQLTKAQNKRLMVLPGITSSWIANGHHKHSFATWMKMDKEYVHNADFSTDVSILLKTVMIPVNYLISKI